MKTTKQQFDLENKDNWDLALEVFFQQTHLHCERCMPSRSVKPSVIGDSWGILWSFLFKFSNNH